ncbi:hypothetical protein ABPG74_014707 [Tetrahymena malaccensis]
MEFVISLKSKEQNQIKDSLQDNIQDLKKCSNLVINIRYKSKLLTDTFNYIATFFSANNLYQIISSISIIVEGQNDLKNDDINSINEFIQNFISISCIQISLWKNCFLSGELFSQLLENLTKCSSLKIFKLDIENNEQIINFLSVQLQIQSLKQIQILDISSTDLSLISNESVSQLFKCVSSLTQLKNLKFSIIFSLDQEAMDTVYSTLKQLQQINNLTIRFMQKEATVFTEKLYLIISQNMLNLEYLTLIFDNCYIHLPHQDFYFQQIINLKHLSVQIKGYLRSTFRQLSHLINCISQLKYLEDLDLFIVSSDYNLLSQDLIGIKNILYLKSLKLKLQMDNFYHEEQFIQFLNDLFSIQSLQVIEIYSNICLLTQQQQFLIYHPMILQLMYTNGTDLIEYFDFSHYFKSNKQLILTILIFKKHLQTILLNNPYQIAFDFHIK